FQSQAKVVHVEDVEFTPDEQFYLGSYFFQDLKRFQFLVAVCPEEGSFSSDLTKITMNKLDPGLYYENDVVREIKEEMIPFDSLPIKGLLRVIKGREELALAKPVSFAPQPRAGQRNRLS